MQTLGEINEIKEPFFGRKNLRRLQLIEGGLLIGLMISFLLNVWNAHQIDALGIIDCFGYIGIGWEFIFIPLLGIINIKIRKDIIYPIYWVLKVAGLLFLGFELGSYFIPAFLLFFCAIFYFSHKVFALFFIAHNYKPLFVLLAIVGFFSLIYLDSKLPLFYW